MFYFPEFDGSAIHWVLAYLLFTSPLLFLSEAMGWFSFGYSKFAQREKSFALPSRLGMFIIYFPATFLYWVPPAMHETQMTGWHLLCGSLVTLHFLKRCFEVLFVHRYSGVMNGGSVAMICVMYSFEAWLLGYAAATEVSPALLQSGAFTPWLRTGLVLWGTGTALNLFHHIVLAQLRKPGETGYKLPKRGLFRFVACPHYLAELVAWWGFALVFHHGAAAIIALVMTFYLGGRAHNTVKWYRERLGDEVPRSWKRLLPFVY